MTLWLTIAQAGDVESGQKFQVIMSRGDFPITSGNGSVISFLMEKSKNWIEKGMIELPARFGQQLCTNLITIAKLLNWIQLGIQIVGLLFGLGYLIWFLVMWY